MKREMWGSKRVYEAVINGQRISLLRLIRIVITKGGEKTVTESQGWNAIALEFGCQSNNNNNNNIDDNPGELIRHLYRRCILAFELEDDDDDVDGREDEDTRKRLRDLDVARGWVNPWNASVMLEKRGRRPRDENGRFLTSAANDNRSLSVGNDDRDRQHVRTQYHHSSRDFNTNTDLGESVNSSRSSSSSSSNHGDGEASNSDEQTLSKNMDKEIKWNLEYEALMSNLQKAASLYSGHKSFSFPIPKIGNREVNLYALYNLVTGQFRGFQPITTENKWAIVAGQYQLISPFMTPLMTIEDAGKEVMSLYKRCLLSFEQHKRFSSKWSDGANTVTLDNSPALPTSTSATKSPWPSLSPTTGVVATPSSLSSIKDSIDRTPKYHQFIQELKDFLRNKKQSVPLDPEPVIDNRKLDMLLLFREVMVNGGAVGVTKSNSWDTVAQKLGFQSNNGGLNGLFIKMRYELYLEPFEKSGADYAKLAGCSKQAMAKSLSSSKVEKEEEKQWNKGKEVQREIDDASSTSPASDFTTMNWSSSKVVVQDNIQRTEEYEIFVDRLEQFSKKRRIPFLREPILDNRKIDLFQLFQATRRHGGSDKISHWKSFTTNDLGLSGSEFNRSYVKKICLEILEPFQGIWQNVQENFGLSSRAKYPLTSPTPTVEKGLKRKVSMTIDDYRTISPPPQQQRQRFSLESSLSSFSVSQLTSGGGMPTMKKQNTTIWPEYPSSSISGSSSSGGVGSSGTGARARGGVLASTSGLRLGNNNSNNSSSNDHKGKNKSSSGHDEDLYSRTTRFLDYVEILHVQTGRQFIRVPTFYNTELNLLQLYENVQAEGGSARAADILGFWSKVYIRQKVKTSSKGASSTLKAKYVIVLEQFEKEIDFFLNLTIPQQQEQIRQERTKLSNKQKQELKRREQTQTRRNFSLGDQQQQYLTATNLTTTAAAIAVGVGIGGKGLNDARPLQQSSSSSSSSSSSASQPQQDQQQQQQVFKTEYERRLAEIDALAPYEDSEEEPEGNIGHVGGGGGGKRIMKYISEEDGECYY